MSEEQLEHMDEEFDQEYLDYEEILEEYRRRQMIEHLTGPMISLVLHVVVIVLCAVFLVGEKTTAAPAEIEFEVKEVEVKPIDPEILEDIDKIEEDIVDDPVPTVDRPEIQPDVVDSNITEDFDEAMASSEIDMDFATDLDIRPTKSPIVLSGVFTSRSAENRGKAIRRHGGKYGQAAEASVIKALQWLKNHQNADGSWSTSAPSAMTGLGLLTFLAHNETPDSKEYGVTVQKAIQWLVNDVMSENRPGYFAYTNGIRAYALSEAYAMTGKMMIIKPAMNKAIKIIIDGQQDNGGYDYGYGKGDRWDLSVAGWQMQALKAAYVAGCDEPGLQEAIEKAIDFTKNVTFQNGKFGYSSPGEGTWGVTGAGTLALQLLGEGKSNEVSEALIAMKELAPEWKPNQFAHGACYGWYYITQAKFHGGTGHFRDWNNRFAPLMVSNQMADGHWDSPAIPGEESHDHAGGSEYEPYYNTCLNALSLMVYYRYLPSYKEPEKVKVETDIFSMDL
jgi:hypothetical protein